MKGGATTRDSLEKQKLKGKLGDFEWEKSEVRQWMAETFGRELKQFELQQIAENCVLTIKKTTGRELKLDREAKRRKTFLWKWYSENFGEIKDILSRIVLRDENGECYGRHKEVVEKMYEQQSGN